MTVIAKPSPIKKAPLIDESRCDEDIIQLVPAVLETKRYKGVVLCLGVTAVTLLMIGVMTAMQVYQQVMNDAVFRHSRYQGFCSIPMSRDIQQLEQQRKAPLRWQSTHLSEPDIQVISITDQDPNSIFNLLREVLDVDIDDSVEKISVINNGHPVTFVHDFGANVSGIVDTERCFAMELDPEMVLKPESLVTGMQKGDEFDVSPVRTQLRVIMPPSEPTSRVLRERCTSKPTYQLKRDGDTAIRKRSVDAPPHDYIQFAGKHVQEIEISNLAELLEYEQKKKMAD